MLIEVSAGGKSAISKPSSCRIFVAIGREAQRVLESFGAGPGHIFNLGHGITPGVDPEHVAVLVETVKAWKK